ncbi:sialate O-acetylesterase [Arachidicoccus rhizosphaerae]|jgi:sialate O-acetylesterase|uniref:Sialate O-acetylesterase n=1 Tax=Arachidicoccus rhizosphaerae TaxID=551991 RepID=A0A1H4AEK5_9BACT|nr:sialate O-acetylesterase [Arachidicoccus rhizosphaerae]SEA34543.1 sialate O-acetylesterase [Arachidicoccus rhizosphaerae]
MRYSLKGLLATFLLLGLFSCANAAIRLPNILSSGVVLQQKSDIQLWGWASPNEKLSIWPSWQKDSIQVRANPDGKWLITLHTPAAGGPYTIDFDAHNHIRLSDVWLGEVWVCSGQSNMEFTYNWRKTKDIQIDFDSCQQYNLHFFQVPKTTGVTPQEDLPGSWSSCDSNTVKDFSAVAYFFGKKLNKNLHVPIGLISSNWGGTPAEVWTPAELVNENPFLHSWQEKLKPSVGWPILAGRAYNGMIYPLTNFAIAGTIWYQGESNVETYQSYGQLFKTMIRSWRARWNQDFPFYFVQIAPYHYGANNGAELRDQQAQALQLPHTGMVVTADLVSDTNDIHPHDKYDVGARLANMALSDHYQLTGDFPKSPVLAGYTLNGARVQIRFSDAAGGLKVKSGDVQQLFIAGSDGHLYPANLKIEKDGSITVSSKDVSAPKLVEYGFTNTRLGNLVSGQGLPVAPFRIQL